MSLKYTPEISHQGWSNVITPVNIYWVAIIWKLRFTLESQANYYSCVILAYIIQFSQRFCAKYFLRNLKIFICSHFIAQNVQEGLIWKVPNKWLLRGIQYASLQWGVLACRACRHTPYKNNTKYSSYAEFEIDYPLIHFPPQNKNRGSIKIS